MKIKMKIPRKQQFILWGIAGTVFVLAVLFWAFARYPLMRASGSFLGTGDGSNAPQNVAAGSIGLPVRLEIPEINVNAVIEYVGLTPQGAMAVPEGPVDVAWFDLGPFPGENGSAVIAGHEGWKDGIAAVFDDLYKLRAGDKILIEDGNGATVTFVVREIRTYDQNGNASSVFDSTDGRSHLNLITCEGTWNAAEKSYSDRLVVFADKEAN